MKPMRISENIIPIAKFKAQASRSIAAVRTTKQPLVITQGGTPVAVLISPEDFDQFVEHERFMSGLNTGLSDLKSKRMRADKEIDEILDTRYGKLS
jgi:prevent-host-death family protein